MSSTSGLGLRWTGDVAGQAPGTHAVFCDLVVARADDGATDPERHATIPCQIRVDRAWRSTRSALPELGATIRERRLSLQDPSDNNPSRRPTLGDQLQRAYRLGGIMVIKEAHLEEAAFSAEYPYSVAQVLDEGYYPA